MAGLKLGLGLGLYRPTIAGTLAGPSVWKLASVGGSGPDGATSAVNARHMSRKALFAGRSMPSGFRVNWPWFSYSNGGDSVGGLGAGTLKASVIVNGVLTPCRFSSAPTITTSAGATLVCDTINIPLNQGDRVDVLTYGSPATGMRCPRSSVSANLTLGEACMTGPAVADCTDGTAFTSDGGFMYAPVGLTSLAPSSFFAEAAMGDSRTAGLYTGADEFGNRSYIGRSCGNSIPFVNLGVASLRVQADVTASAYRRALLVFLGVNVVHYPGGINDLRDGQTGAQVAARLAAFAALLAGTGIRLRGQTVMPFTASVNAGVDQTFGLPGANNAPLVDLNTLIRLGIAGFFDFVEIDDVVATGRNTGIWRYFGDGLHPGNAPSAIGTDTSGQTQLLSAAMIASRLR